MTVTEILTFDELCAALDHAEREYMAAEFIDNTQRMLRERAYWRARVKRIRDEIELRTPSEIDTP